MNEPLKKEENDFPMSIALGDLDQKAGWDPDAKTSLTELPDVAAKSLVPMSEEAAPLQDPLPEQEVEQSKIDESKGLPPVSVKVSWRQLFLLMLLACAGGLYFLSEGEEGAEFPIFDLVLEYLDLKAPETFQTKPVVKLVATKAPSEASLKPELPLEEAQPTVQVFAGDPYLHLPNKLQEPQPLRRIWTASEEQKWREGLRHPFIWQRYKTVQEVRAARLTQSKVILWDALDDGIFWVRMRAIQALADFGLPLTIDNVGKAIGDASDSLTAHYFMRFIKKLNPSDLFVLRLAINIVAVEPRLQILRAFTLNQDDDVSRLYLFAATKDPDPRIRRFASKVTRHWSQEKLKQIEEEFKQHSIRTEKRGVDGRQ